MGVWIKDESKYWKSGIPYTIGDSAKDCENKLLGLIDAFNQAVGKKIFFPREDNEANYVVFNFLGGSGGGDSPLGMQGKEQKLYFDFECLYHEMGHCCGLGHEHYQSDWMIKHLLAGIDKDDWNKQVGKYKNNMQYNKTSMMCYPLTSLSTSPALQSAIKGIEINPDPNKEKNQRKRASSLGGDADEVDEIAVTKKDINLVKQFKRSENGNNMRVDAADAKIIVQKLCPDAADL